METAILLLQTLRDRADRDRIRRHHKAGAKLTIDGNAIYLAG
jgi:hypothetical protein